MRESEVHLFAWVEEAMAPVGRVTMRRMMGGATLYCDGIIFAISDDGELWFKSDKISDAQWDAVDAERFTYSFKDGRVDTMNYRRAPSEVYDDGDALRQWAGLALEAGMRARK